MHGALPTGVASMAWALADGSANRVGLIEDVCPLPRVDHAAKKFITAEMVCAWHTESMLRRGRTRAATNRTECEGCRVASMFQGTNARSEPSWARDWFRPVYGCFVHGTPLVPAGVYSLSPRVWLHGCPSPIESDRESFGGRCVRRIQVKSPFERVRRRGVPPRL